MPTYLEIHSASTRLLIGHINFEKMWRLSEPLSEFVVLKSKQVRMIPSIMLATSLTRNCAV